MYRFFIINGRKYKIPDFRIHRHRCQYGCSGYRIVKNHNHAVSGRFHYESEERSNLAGPHFRQVSDWIFRKVSNTSQPDAVSALCRYFHQVFFHDCRRHCKGREKRPLPYVAKPCRFDPLGGQGLGYGHTDRNSAIYHFIIHGGMTMMGTMNHFLCQHPFDIGGIFFQSHIHQIYGGLQVAGNHIDRTISLGHQFHFIMRKLPLCFVLTVHRRISTKNNEGLVQVGRLYFPPNSGDTDCHFFQFS